MEWTELFKALGLDPAKVTMLASAIYLLVESIKKQLPGLFGNGSKWETRVLSLVVTSPVVVINYVGFPNLPVYLQLGIITILMWLFADGIHHIVGKVTKKE